MQFMAKKILVGFLALVVLCVIGVIPTFGEVPAGADFGMNWTAYLQVNSSSLSMSASQTVGHRECARFDMAFGHKTSAIQVGQERDPEARPVIPRDVGGDEPHSVISISACPLEQHDGNVVLKLIIQVGSRNDAGLKSRDDWRFERLDNEVTIQRGENYDFVVEDPLSHETYRMSLSLAAPKNVSRSTYSRAVDYYNQERALEAEFYAELILYDLTDKGGPARTRATKSTYMDVDDDGVAKAEIAVVVYPEQADSCYHYVTITLTDLRLSPSGNRLRGTMKIDRSTVYGSDSPIDAKRYSCDMIKLDNFEREIRLAKGKTLAIVIAPEDDNQFPFDAEETIEITADW